MEALEYAFNLRVDGAVRAVEGKGVEVLSGTKATGDEDPIEVVTAHVAQRYYWAASDACQP